MRILHLISSEGVYGAETMLLGLAKASRALGHEARLAVFHNSHRPHREIADAAERHAIPVEMVPCNGRADWNAVRAIRRCIERQSIDVVHTHGYKGNLYGYAASRESRAALLATCHNWTDETVSLRVYRLVDYLVLRGFRRVVAVSDAVAALLRRAGIRPEHITTIDNGIDLSPFQAARPTLREELGGAPGTVVGFVGRLTSPKGAQYFLQAARSIAGHVPGARFVLVGDGPERQSLEELARGFGIAGQVVFAGHRSDMPGVYASLDVLVLPSINEGLPMTILEAMASGIPVVATAVGAVPKLVLPGRTGLLVHPRDALGLAEALERLLTDPALRRELAEHGRDWVSRRFSAAAMAGAYLEIYGELIGAHRTRQGAAARAA